jgi:hypothetical protein|tara:strand:- start:189 stop:752 length:564 start_codon:yes stop_codon:yes gene_type:complete
MVSKSGGPPLRIVSGGKDKKKKETHRKVKSGYDQEFTLPAGTSAAPIKQVKFSKTQAKKDAKKDVVKLKEKKKPGPKKKEKLKKGQYRIENYDLDVFDPGFGKKTKVVNYKPKIYTNRKNYERDQKAGKLREGDTLKEKIPFTPQEKRFFEVAEKHRHLPFDEYKKAVIKDMKKPFLVPNKSKKNRP